MKCWCLKDQSVVHFKIPFHGTLHSSKNAEWIQCECAIFSHCSTTLARKLWTNNCHVCFSRCCSLSFFVLICLWERTIPTSQKRKRRHVKAKPINTGSIFPNRVQLHWVFLSMGERCLKIVSSSWERHRCHSFFSFLFSNYPWSCFLLTTWAVSHLCDHSGYLFMGTLVASLFQGISRVGLNPWA